VDFEPTLVHTVKAARKRLGTRSGGPFHFTPSGQNRHVGGFFLLGLRHLRHVLVNELRAGLEGVVGLIAFGPDAEALVNRAVEIYTLRRVLPVYLLDSLAQESLVELRFTAAELLGHVGRILALASGRRDVGDGSGQRFGQLRLRLREARGLRDELTGLAAAPAQVSAEAFGQAHVGRQGLVSVAGSLGHTPAQVVGGFRGLDAIGDELARPEDKGVDGPVDEEVASDAARNIHGPKRSALASGSGAGSGARVLLALAQVSHLALHLLDATRNPAQIRLNLRAGAPHRRGLLKFVAEGAGLTLCAGQLGRQCAGLVGKRSATAATGEGVRFRPQLAGRIRGLVQFAGRSLPVEEVGTGRAVDGRDEVASAGCKAPLGLTLRL
jgi:hypothetical protein